MNSKQHEVTRRLHLMATSARTHHVLNISVADALELLGAVAAVDSGAVAFVRLEAGGIIELLNRLWIAEANADRQAAYATQQSEHDAIATAESH